MKIKKIKHFLEKDALERFTERELENALTHTANGTGFYPNILYDVGVDEYRVPFLWKDFIALGKIDPNGKDFEKIMRVGMPFWAEAYRLTRPANRRDFEWENTFWPSLLIEKLYAVRPRFIIWTHDEATPPLYENPGKNSIILTASGFDPIRSLSLSGTVEGGRRKPGVNIIEDSHRGGKFEKPFERRLARLFMPFRN